jgi:hypothetical protein
MPPQLPPLLLTGRLRTVSVVVVMMLEDIWRPANDPPDRTGSAGLILLEDQDPHACRLFDLSEVLEVL